MNAFKLIGFSFLSFFLLFFSSCSKMKYDIEPGTGGVFQSMKIKVNVRPRDSNKVQNFKIILKYDQTKDKMLFLSPLNQVYGILVVQGENALLVNTKKKKYWNGPFHLILEEMWGTDMDFRYDEFKQLLVDGLIPEEKLQNRSIRVSVDKFPNSEKPERLKIITPDVTVKLKISDHITENGSIRFDVNIKGMTQAENIAELLE